MTYQPVDVIEVRCWGERVGALALDPTSGYYVFEYDPRWIDSGIELAPIAMPTDVRPPRFIFPTLPIDTYQRLPAMIADSLPDAFGNALTTAYLANEGVRPEQITSLDRLAYLGGRGMGALEYRPLRGPRVRRATAIELSELVMAARSALSEHVDAEESATTAIRHLIAVGTSAGGARAKAVVALNPTTGELRSGQVPCDPGFESWLLKIDGVDQYADLGRTGNYGRIEYAYFLMAQAAGIEMSECRLLEEAGRAHFMTRRFDRTISGDKVHVQTLCALDQVDFKQIGANDYAQLFIAIERLGLDDDARVEAFRRMCFNVAAANCDDHSKNFAFTMSRDGRWALSPAHDVTHAFSPTSEWTREHLMAVNGARDAINRRDLMEVADRFQIPGAVQVIRDVLAAIDEWPSFATLSGLPQHTTEAVGADITNWTSPLR